MIAVFVHWVFSGVILALLIARFFTMMLGIAFVLASSLSECSCSDATAWSAESLCSRLLVRALPELQGLVLGVCLNFWLSVCHNAVWLKVLIYVRVFIALSWSAWALVLGMLLCGFCRGRILASFL